MRARHFVVYEGDDLMAFSSEEEQLRKFRNDEIAQHYFEVLRTLISKKSIFAQNIGLYDVAAYLGEIFSGVGAEVTITRPIRHHLSWQNSRVQIQMRKQLFSINTMIRFLRIMISHGQMNLSV